MMPTEPLPGSFLKASQVSNVQLAGTQAPCGILLFKTAKAEAFKTV